MVSVSLVMGIKTIMVIDEKTEILSQVKSYLEKDEFTIITADNNRQAIKLMDKEKTIDLILVTTSLPAIDKTAFFSMKPSARFFTEGSDNFLQKPFTKKQLVDFINEKINER